MINIEEHGGTFGGGSGGAIKFAPVVLSLTAPLSPKQFTIWVVSDQEKNKVYFAPNDTGQLTVNGDVFIGTAGIINVMNSLVKKGMNSLASVPNTVTANHRKIFTTPIENVYGTLGNVKVKKPEGVRYASAHIYINSSWIQFSVDENVEVAIFSRNEGGAYTVKKFSANDELLLSYGSNWSTPSTSTVLGYPSIVFWNPITNRYVHSDVSGGKTVEYGNFYTNVLPDPNFRAIGGTSVNPGVVHGSAITSGRKYLYSLVPRNNSAPYNQLLLCYDYETGLFVGMWDLGVAYGTLGQSFNTKYSELAKTIVTISTFSSYGTLTIIDTSKVPIGGAPTLVSTVLGAGWSTASGHEFVAVNKSGTKIVTSAVNASAIKVYGMNGVEIKSIAYSVLDVKPTTIYTGGIWFDQYDNIYLCMFKESSNKHALFKLNQDLGIIWQIEMPGSIHDLKITKEDILYIHINGVSLNGKLLKYNTRGELISTVATDITAVNNVKPMVTKSPDLSAFPEFW